MTFRRREGCLTRACSRQARLAPGSARAVGFLSAVRKVGVCGRRVEGLQLLRQVVRRQHVRVTMNWRALSWIVLGVASTLLGVLWLLQGADLLHIRPILCIANCKPVEGGSIAWMTAGALVLVVGLLAIAAGLRRRGRRA
jgi:hypothetical protein